MGLNKTSYTPADSDVVYYQGTIDSPANGGSLPKTFKPNDVARFIYVFYAWSQQVWGVHKTRIKIVTDGAGCQTLSFSCSGEHRTGSSLKWKVTTASSVTSTSGMSNCSASKSNAS